MAFLIGDFVDADSFYPGDVPVFEAVIDEPLDRAADVVP